ncbi:hypothetical protein MBLNU457_7145t1 [Dothideomycetes sp. NU457]
MGSTTAGLTNDKLVHKLLWDEKALEVLHKLPFYKPIVLLTPAVSPLELTENWKEIDPFEAMRNTLSSYHNTMHRHYNPSDGFEHKHGGLVAQAGAVIVVNCEDPSMEDQESEEYLDKQERFADVVVDEAENAASKREGRVPVGLVTCGLKRESRVEKIEEFDFAVACPDYEKKTLEKVTAVLMDKS